MKYLVSLIFLFTLNLNAVEVVLQDPQLNEPAPKFSALDSNGKIISLDDFKGQPVILEWTNHECPYVWSGTTKKTTCKRCNVLLKLKAMFG